MKALLQPIGVYLTDVLDQNGSAILDKHTGPTGRRASWIIVEFGQFDNGFSYVKECVHQQDRDDISAALSTLKRISQMKRIRLNLLECDEALRTGKLPEFGQERLVVNEVIEAVDPFSRRNIDKTNMLFSNEAPKINAILLAGGGGGAVLHRLRQKWPNTVHLPEPRMSVAEGYLQYATSVMQKRLKEQKSADLAFVNG